MALGVGLLFYSYSHIRGWVGKAKLPVKMFPKPGFEP